MNLKFLNEKRTELQEQMENLVNTAELETRALNEEETAKFDDLEKQIKNIDATIERMEKTRSMEKKETVEKVKDEDVTVIRERAFLNYLGTGRAPIETRAAANFTLGNNGAIVPTTIAKDIVKAVYDVCPILSMATRYNVKGTIKVPVYSESGDSAVTTAFGADFTDLTAHSGNFTSVDLTGHLAGNLVLMGLTAVNNADFDVRSFFVKETAENIARFLENRLLNGTSSESKNIGLVAGTNTLVAGSTTAITTDNLIDLQMQVKQAYQKNACWIMNPATMAKIRKLKDLNGIYILQPDLRQGFGYQLLGKPVYVSDNCATIASAAKAVYYGDFSGLAVNFRESINTQILTEKYATQHAVGIVNWFEFDSKIIDNSRFAALVMSTAS